MGKDAPDPPDYASAAAQTAAGDLESARLNVLANRPNIYTPEGSTTWERGIGGDPDRWAATQALTPEGQAAFESNQRLQTGLGGLGEQAVGSVGDLFGTSYTTPGDTPTYQGPAGELSPYGERRQEITDAMLSRVNTDVGRDREAKSAQLIAAGHQKGSEGYNREMENIDRQLTDARQQAEISASQMVGQESAQDIARRGQMGREGMADFTTGLDLQRQQVANALQERVQPLQEISAFRTGSQVNVPGFQPYGQQAFTGGPDMLAAAQGQFGADLGAYNAQQAPWNALIGAAGTLGGAAMMSDIRLKRDIEHVDNMSSGLPVYKFKYIWSDKPEIGVMAQDVIDVFPEAVIEVGGYMAVDYRMIH